MSYIVSTKNVDNLLSLTASEEVATFEAASLQDPLGTKRWRSTGITPNLIGQFAAAKTIDFWGLWYCNAKSGDQARLRLANSQANLTAAPLYDSGLVDVWPGTGDLSSWESVHQRAKIPVASQVSATWWRIDCDFTGNSDGYVQAGALFLDAKFQPELGVAAGWSLQPISRAVHAVNYAAGGTGRGGGSYKRDISFRFEALSDSEAWGELEEILRDRAQIGTVGLVLKEDDDHPMDFMFYGYLDAKSIVSLHGRKEADLLILEP